MVAAMADVGRGMKPEMLVTLSGGRAANFEIGVDSSLPEWTQVECALSAVGVAEHHWEALRFTYAGIDTHRSMLKARLLVWFERARHRENWPQQVMTLAGCADYREPLVELHFLEERQPWRFRISETYGIQSVEMCAVVMNVANITWSKKLRPIYGSMQAEWLRWQSIAASSMKRKLRAENDD